MSLAITLLLLAGPSSTFASKSFPDCSIPSEDDAFMSAPNVRSTLGIAWSALATIIACTYGVLHLNVPQQRSWEPPMGYINPWLRRDRLPSIDWAAVATVIYANLEWYWNGLRPSIDWTVVTVMFPELYTAIAYDDLVRACRTRAELSKALQETDGFFPQGGISKVHGFFANMGGFAIRCRDTSQKGSPTALFHLNGKSLLALLECERQARSIVPLLSRMEIEDRSKSNLFAKSVVLLQVLYYCASCVVRWTEGLPVTPLEIGTLGFAVCSIISFGLLFLKPRSVNTTTVIADFEYGTPTYIDKLHKQENRKNPALVNNSGMHPDYKDFTVPVLAALLGAIHAAGWKYQFHLLVEEWLWCICTIISATSLPVLWAFAWLCLHESERPVLYWPLSNFFKTLFHAEQDCEAGLQSLGTCDDGSLRPPVYAKLVLVICLILYCASRIVLMIQMVRCLFFLPREAFFATWAAGLPHFG